MTEMDSGRSAGLQGHNRDFTKSRGANSHSNKTDTIAFAMLILVSSSLFFITSLALVILRIARPNARYSWLIAIGGAFLAFIGIFGWLAQIPATLTLLTWQPNTLFTSPILFRADGISWPYAISISAVTLTVLLTAAARPIFTNSYTWAGSLALGGLGLLAVTANNPFTLLLVWSALDITELLVQLRSVNGPQANEKVVISFSTRVLGIGVLLWANIVGISSGSGFDFISLPSGAKLYLIAAAGLRLGVLPLHLPYSSESSLRRGFGTSLRLVSVASSLILLARVPAEGPASTVTSILILLSVAAAVYGGWMWLRAPDELNGRPYWIIGVAALSVTSALIGNPLGAVAWGCVLILSGGALFLASIQHAWLNRALLAGAFSLSALPFSLTGSAWLSGMGFFAPFALTAQALLIAGYIRHTIRPGGRDSLEVQPKWTRMVYPAGIGLLIGLQILLGLFGWEGARQTGPWVYPLLGLLLAFGLIWATPRFRVLNPVQTHRLNLRASGLENIYSALWGIYRALGRLSETINSTLEGDGGLMWTLLFLVLFVSLMTQGAP